MPSHACLAPCPFDRQTAPTPGVERLRTAQSRTAAIDPLLQPSWSKQDVSAFSALYPRPLRSMHGTCTGTATILCPMHIPVAGIAPFVTCPLLGPTTSIAPKQPVPLQLPWSVGGTGRLAASAAATAATRARWSCRAERETHGSCGPRGSRGGRARGSSRRERRKSGSQGGRLVPGCAQSLPDARPARAAQLPDQAAGAAAGGSNVFGVLLGFRMGVRVWAIQSFSGRHEVLERARSTAR